MSEEIPGTDKIKVEVLKSAVRALMEDNETKIKAGIGSLYGSKPSGVQWPISDLNADASTIDPAISPGISVREVMSTQLERKASGATATVDALAEAANYFSGGKVYHNNRPHNDAHFHKPDRWNQAARRYDPGYIDAAIPSSYWPRNAYKRTFYPTFRGTCQDYTLDGTVDKADFNGKEEKTNDWCRNNVGVEPKNQCTKVKAGSYKRNGETIYHPAYLRCDYFIYGLWEQPTYVSPISSQCDVNAVILVSDGEPRVRGNDSEIKRFLGKDLDTCERMTDIFADTEEGKVREAAGRCGPELAERMATKKVHDGIESSFVRTFTIGFDTKGPGRKYLEKVALKGKGDFFNADSPEALKNAFDSILSDLLTTSQSFSPLAVDVDRSSFSHENRLFYSMFEPSAKSSWGGNLKGFFLGENGLMDINNAEATEVTAGVRQMSRESQSFWSVEADGDRVTAGGANSKLRDADRNLYTYTGDASLNPADASFSSRGVNLTLTDDHELDSDNDRITDAMLGRIPNRDTVLDWIVEAPMGDPMHSQPVQVKYTDNSGDRRNVMYVMTNQGFLHAFDATQPTLPNGNSAGGEEIFAFMPQELLKNIPLHYARTDSTNHIYGLDGSLVRWHDDENMDGIVNGSDTVTLVFGMRRGGTHYYAMDVTDPEAPRLLWRLDGGVGELAQMGETWSRPSVISVIDDGEPVEVLAFGGGYEAAKLDGTTENTTSKGNGIFLVDHSGEVLWKVDGSNTSGMDYAIPSDLATADTDNDGSVDRIYVGDLGGQVWRIDLNDIDSSSSTRLLAELDDVGHTTFFYPPSVALNSSVNGDFLSVSIGSGNRTNPLRHRTNDRIFMIRDKFVKDRLPDNFTAFGVSDLYDATENDINSTVVSEALAAKSGLSTKQGWYIDLGVSEKSLSQVVTYDGKILATTFDAGDPDNFDLCQAAGSNRFYLMDVTNAAPLDNLDGVDTGTLTASDRSKGVNGDGILSQPVVLFPPSGDVSIAVDNEIVQMFGQSLSRVYWHSK